MGSARRARVERLVAVRAQKVDVARTALGGAQRARILATEAQDAAEAAWLDRVRALASARLPTVDALVEGRAHLDGLRRRANAAAVAVLDARRAEQAALVACLMADRELKKVETWRDRLAEAERAEADRRERLLTDEAAARIFVRGAA
jgi:hypothetical protein